MRLLDWIRARRNTTGRVGFVGSGLRSSAAVAIAAVVAGAGASSAQDLDPWDTPEPERTRSYDRSADTGSDRERRPLSTRFGIGFTADPDTFLMGLEVDYHVLRAVSVGAQIHVGVDDDQSLLSPVLYGRYHLFGGDFDVNDTVDKLSAYGHVGLGFNYQDFDGRPRPRRDDDDLQFLWNTGVGLEYAINEDVSVNSQMLLNFVPNGLFGDHSYFSWEIVGVRYRF
ncbi:MAG: outer membrane beta-barrel protein [Myxococcota bacterium]